MPWALTTFGPEGALTVMKTLPPVAMKPGWTAPLVYWPTITPRSLIPKASADDPPVGMNAFKGPPLGRENALPLPSVPTTVPMELTPKAMAAVDPRLKTLAVVELRGFAVKLV